MKVFVIVHEFPPIGGGGGRAAYDICKGLVERGHQVTVLTSRMKGLSAYDTISGVQVIRLFTFRREAYRAPLASMFVYILVGIFAGYFVIRKLQPDVLHCHFAVPAGALGWMLSRMTGIPYILTAHLGDVPGGVPEKTDRWFRWMYPFTPPIWKGARKVVAVSEYTRRLAARTYPVQMEVIPNGVELTQSELINREIHLPVRLVFAGRFMPQKNPIQLINILSELSDLSWRCSMVGDGPLLDDVKKLVKEVGLSERVEFPGWVTPEQVLIYLSKADILVMPSLSEGLPVIGVQALAQGLALVVSKVGGFVDLVEEEKNGYLIEPIDKTGFVKSLRYLITNPNKLAQFQNASQIKARNYDLEKVVRRYEGVLLGSQKNGP